MFAEDSAALADLLIAAAWLAAHQLTGSPIPDAAGSILVGLLLAVIAIVLINRNRRFLVGQEADPRVRAATIQALLDAPEVAQVTYRGWRSSGRGWSRWSATSTSPGMTPSHTWPSGCGRSRPGSAPRPRWPATVLSLSAPDEPTLEV